MLTPAYGAIGRACLQPNKARQFSESTEITPEIADSLDFITLPSRTLDRQLKCNRRPSQRLFRRAGLCTHHQPIPLHNLGPASLWIDYVPSKSNSADAPSRFHEMTREAIYYFGERLAWRSIYGSYTCAGDSGWPMAIILRDCIFDLGVGTPYSYNVLCAIVSSAGCHFRQRLL